MSDGIIGQCLGFLTGHITLEQLRAWRRDRIQSLHDDPDPDRRALYGHLACLLAEYGDGYRDETNLRDSLAEAVDECYATFKRRKEQRA